MPGFDTNIWAVMLLVLVLGWLLGLMSRSGGSKWRRAHERQRADHLAATAAHDAELARAQARIAELERAASVSAGAAATATGAVAPAGGDRRDDLSRIHGVDGAMATRLYDLGVLGYHDLAGMTAADETAIEERLGIAPGTVTHQRWREQADLLANGRDVDHGAIFGNPDRTTRI